MVLPGCLTKVVRAGLARSFRLYDYCSIQDAMGRCSGPSSRGRPRRLLPAAAMRSRLSARKLLTRTTDVVNNNIFACERVLTDGERAGARRRQCRIEG